MKKMLFIYNPNAATELKTVRNDGEYGAILAKYRDTDVLYIDDLFKTQHGKSPTEADIGIAFDILDGRYRNQKGITILSTEKSLAEIRKLDYAIAGRIAELSMSEKYRPDIGIVPDRDMRWKK